MGPRHKTHKSVDQECVFEKLTPWAIVVALLICGTVVMAFYYADDMKGAHARRKQQAEARNGRKGRFASLTGTYVTFTPPWHSETSPDAVTGATPKRTAFNRAITLISPSVVGINTSGAEGQSASGVIVHRRGFILTNHHVIDGAKDIVVTLTVDQQIKSYSAIIVDSKPKLDLAIIQLKSTGKKWHNLSPAPLGDSGKMLIGDDVVAIGSPFGLSGSASAGIVSNPQRTLTAGNRVFKDLIQTDASINPGSSGGPLVNTKGEVIGINMAIVSPVEGFTGIGFAIPINKAKQAFKQFIEIIPSPFADNNAKIASRSLPQEGNAFSGTMRLMAKRPAKQCWLGIAVYPVGTVVQREFDLPFRYGVLVNRVFPDSPAAKAGLMRGDVMFRIDQSRIRDDKMLWSILKDKKTGAPVTIVYFRKGKFKTCIARLEPEPPNARALISAVPQGPAAGAVGPEGIEEISWLGIDIQPLTNPEALAEYGLTPDMGGVYIGEVEGVAGIEAGLVPGDLIQKVNNREFKDIAGFKDIIKTVDISKGVLLDVVRNKRPFFITIRPTERDMGAWQ